MPRYIISMIIQCIMGMIGCICEDWPSAKTVQYMHRSLSTCMIKFAEVYSQYWSLGSHEAVLLGFWPISCSYVYMYSSLKVHANELIFIQFYPCRGGVLEIVKYLVEVQRCSARCTDNSGRTPLHLACE